MGPKKVRSVDSVDTATSPKRLRSAVTRNGLDKTSDNEALDKETTLPDSKKNNTKLNLKALKQKGKQSKTNLPVELPEKCKPKVMVDIEIMKEELRQLEDPPVTNEEQQLSQARLGFDFFNVPCEMLAKNLLGKILVRRLENGTLLKGRIVETEAYLGGEDKASQTYQNKITPRNAPMYMPPGTIYVYMTYGIYHCFNISSQGKGSCIFIRALDPNLDVNTMELHRNIKLKRATKYNEIHEKMRHFEPYQLCNVPSKLCTVFHIVKEKLNKKTTQCPELWIEINPGKLDEDLKIIITPRIGIVSAGDGAAVLVRAVAPIEGQEEMTQLRKSNLPTKSRQSWDRFNVHDLCNGPSKFCIAFQLNRIHSRYSLCTWKGMWIEDNKEDKPMRIISCPRIGIDSAGKEWAQKPLRLYIYGEESVSKRDKKAEVAC